jgi:hypothetical protein
MNATIALPRLWRANGRADLAFIGLAALIAVIASVAVASSGSLVVRGAAGLFSVAVITVLLIVVKRLELALYVVIPLLTVVRVEPAPVDFMVIALMAALGLRGELRRFVPSRIVVLGLALILVSYAVSVLAAHDQSAAVKYAAATLLVIAAGYTTFALASRDPMLCARAFVLAGALLGLEALAAFSPVAFGDVFRMDAYRVEGLFKDPNVFGPFVAPAVALLCLGRPTLPTIARVTLLALALAPVPASLSRGAVVVVGVSLVAVGIVAAYRRWRDAVIYSLGLAAVGAVALLILLALPGSSLAQQRLSLGPQGYDEQRFAGQTAGLTYFASHPTLSGIGPGNYDPGIGQPSHETYIRMLVETGPVSLLGLGMVVWPAARMIRRADRATVAWVAALIGFAAYGFFIDILHWRHFWVVLAVPLAIHAYEERRTVRVTKAEASKS